MRILVYIILLFVATGMNAQEKIMLYSHYYFNGLAINPAYTGSKETLSAGLSHRSQWMGFEGAPSFNILSIHAPYKDSRMALGLLVMNESMGLRKYTGIYVNYAYRIPLSQGKLAFGLKGGIGTGSMDAVDMNTDIVFSDKSRNYLLPNFGLGIYYSRNKLHAGLSLPLLFGYKSNDAGKIVAYNDFKNYAYYFFLDYLLEISNNWHLQPAALLEYNKSAGMVADLGTSLWYLDFLRAGISYRTTQAFIFMADYKINYQFRIGIAYDYGIGGINTYNRNSFEIALEYNFGYKINASNPTVF